MSEPTDTPTPSKGVPQAPTDVDSADELLIVDSVAILAMVALLILTIITIWIFKTRRLQFVHESGMSIIYGIIAGAIISAAPGSAVQNRTIFDPQTFFFVLLPPIIFTAGYEMKRAHFFRNIGPILLYAFVGTLISTLIVGILVWVITLLGFENYGQIGMVDCFLFGALISATDPVTTLAIFSELNADVNLYNLIFGESVLNDAVAITIYNAIYSFKKDTTHATSIGAIFGYFIINFMGALGIGVAVGIITALVTKFTTIRHEPLLETSLFCLLAYASFLIAQALGFSGIVAVLFCGITDAHYTFRNLSETSKVWTTEFFSLLNFLSENFIFSYMGLSLFTFGHHIWKPFFIIMSIAIIIVARAGNVYPLSFLLNMSRPGNEIPNNHQHMMMWSGLRGAIAFALAVQQTFNKGSGDTEDMILTTTLMIVFVTVFVFGGGTPEMIKLLNIPTGTEVVERPYDVETTDVENGGSGNGGRMRDMEDPVFLRRDGGSAIERMWEYVDHNYLVPLLVSHEGRAKVVDAAGYDLVAEDGVFAMSARSSDVPMVTDGGVGDGRDSPRGGLPARTIQLQQSPRLNVGRSWGRDGGSGTSSPTRSYHNQRSQEGDYGFSRVRGRSPLAREDDSWGRDY
eukprot:Clim_evm8s163 gene=Clim_evmTU8s163